MAEEREAGHAADDDWLFFDTVAEDHGIKFEHTQKVARRDPRACYDDRGEPLACPWCGPVRIEEVITSRIEHLPCEWECVCSQCRRVIGYYAYGSFDPCFMVEHQRNIRDSDWRLRLKVALVVAAVTAAMVLTAALAGIVQ